MKGSPLLRVLFVVLALLALLWPLRSLTTHRAAALEAQEKTPPQNETAREVSVHLVLTSTTFPFAFEISHLGQVIWKGDSTESSVAQDVKMIFPPEGIDLLLDVKWQGEKQTAVKLEVTPNDGDAITKTLWGTTEVNDVLTFVKP